MPTGRDCRGVGDSEVVTEDPIVNTFTCDLGGDFHDLNDRHEVNIRENHRK